MIAQAMTGKPAVMDMEALRREAADCQTTADAAARAFDRGTWVRFFFLFFPIPFVVLLFRLQLDAWHYYLAGALGIGFACLLGVLDRAAMRKRDGAIEAAAEAQAALALRLSGARTVCVELQTAACLNRMLREI